MNSTSLIIDSNLALALLGVDQLQGVGLAGRPEPTMDVPEHQISRNINKLLRLGPEDQQA